MMIFVIFSYNRGIFLDNCVKSIEIFCNNATVIIFDDNSDDSDTLQILKKYEKKHTVLKPSIVQGNQSKHGGLYSNMQEVLKLDLNDDLVCFLQDDTQLVRHVFDEDIYNIRQYFALNQQAAFLSPTFLRGLNRERDLKHVHYNQQKGVYIRGNSRQGAGIHYSDIVIANISKLASENWVFKHRESLNDQIAKKKFGKLGYMKNPFIAWLPNGTVYRGKLKTLAIRLAEKRNNSGFYPIKIDQEISGHLFLEREAKDLPFAEDFLQIKSNVAVKKPWIYHPLQGNFLLKNFNSLETKIRKHLKL